MPSSFKILKNQQTVPLTKFQMMEFDGVPAGHHEKPAARPPEEPVEGSDDMVIQTVVDRGSLADMFAPVNTVNPHSPVIHDITKRDVIQTWSVSEFIRENPVKVEKTIPTSKVEDQSHLLVEAQNRADEIIAEANNTAAALLAEARNEAESLKQKAFMEGMAAAKNEVAETMHQVERILQETQLWQEQVMRQSQSRIMEMILSIGKKLFGHGFELSAENIDHIVSRAINEASRLGNLRIYLNPEDAKLLVNLWQESEITLNGQQIQIVSSQNISRGGCFIDGQFGVVDGRVEEQMDQITSTIKSAEINLEVEE